MKTIRQLLLDTIIYVAIITFVLMFFHAYGGKIMEYLYGDQKGTVFVGDVSIVVSHANDQIEREKGLSGTVELAESEGMFFTFDEESYHGMWMKDMNYPIDILWINNDLKVIHIEENVLPESYPATYFSHTPARFVLETNAYFVDTFRLAVGDKVSVPAADLPPDLKANLR